MVNIDDTIYRMKREQEERHTQELAQKLQLPYASLVGYPLTAEILNLVPEETAIEYKIVPFLKIGKTVKIGVVSPKDNELKEYLEQFSKEFGLEVQQIVISNTSFLYGISIYEKLKKAAEPVVDATKEEVDKSTSIKDLKSAAEAAKNSSVTKLLEIIILGAIKTKSSDIHIEPIEKEFMVRYRIDGILQEVVTLPIVGYKQILSRIKYQSKLRMDVVDKPQDGRFSMPAENGNIDLRVSIMPSTWGESIVMRLLGQEKSILSLDKLGIRPEALAVIKQAITKPYGMILTSGPTGSGKSSTLYAILMALKKPGVKIITLENPVEYRIEGIEQSQVNPDAGYQFADGLKASLRQDPDILMVGEIRDGETAEIAVQAALTGHLLISTIHANSAPAVFARLLEIGVKPFLLSGSVNLIMAQRLIRKVCASCKTEQAPDPVMWQELVNVMKPIMTRLPQNIQQMLSSSSPKLVKAKGCPACNQTGFLGRQMIIETLVPSESIETLIAKGATISEFTREAAAQGMITMEQDGLLKVLEGITTIEEVWRVTKG